MSDTFGSAMPGNNDPQEFPASGASGGNNAPEAYEDCDIESIGTDTAMPKMSQGERRSRRRALISAPVRVRSIDVTGDSIDEASTTLDVSRGGVLFVSSMRAFARGMEVAVTFPYSKSPVAVQAEQTGRIVRVTDMPDGRQSVGVALVGTEGDLVDTAGHQMVSTELSNLQDQTTRSAKPLVLIVDADPGIRTSLKILLGADGYDVVAVSCAREAHEVLKMFTPVLLIAEIEGEDLPGYELCAHVKSTPRLQTIPVMLLTSSAYPSDYASAHSLGAVVCMAKPYRQERLRHVVRLLAPTAEAKAQTAPPRAADQKRRHCSGKAQKGARPTCDSVEHRRRTNI
jgi:CheY-like chemotaxis protein